jgi:uncharacterized protein YdiU (UPF0061 family)
MTVHFPFDNSYARLPERFFAHVAPTPVAAPRLIRLNRDLAVQLGLDPDWLASPEGVEVLAGKRVAEASEPIATAYAGHQFGHFVPQLGDGRAILLGEVVDRHGVRRDIQLKGSGRTPFSRAGDGRAAMGPVLREYLVSEAMAAFGIPTTRSLAAVVTGDTVLRERPLPGAVLTRVASSHIRVGTFQYFAARRDVEGLRVLADHVISRHYAQCAEAERPYVALLQAVSSAQAELIARWLLVGFIHGVMNTDNMSIAGESIDYGPCAFMDAFDPGAVFSSIDHAGRYAYGNQPRIALWNLSRLAEAMLPLFSEDQEQGVEAANEALSGFAPRFQAAYHDGLRRKLGLIAARDEDVALAEDLLAAMAEGKADFTLTFRALGEAASGSAEGVRRQFADPSGFDAWAVRWRDRLQIETTDLAERSAAMDAVNPVYIPRNHRIEAVIQAAVERDDFGPFEELATVLARPFEEQPGMERYAEPPKAHEQVLQTFCGT